MKQKLKLEIFEKRKKISEKELKEKNKKIIENLSSLKEFQEAKNILFYVSCNNEVDTQEIIKELLKEKNIIIPYTIKNKPTIFLSELKDFVELIPKTFGILEPKEKYIREFGKEKLDLVIVPGTVFDKKGNRIGYGFGYYDRFLKTIKKDVLKIGLAFDFQLVDNIPREEHDVPLDVVVTEREVVKCG